MLGAYLGIYGRLPRGPTEASQPEAPIGQDRASRGRMAVTAMASLHEESYSEKRGAVGGRWTVVGGRDGFCTDVGARLLRWCF